MTDKIKSIAKNKKARHDYTILDTYEAGISLAGCEVKSLRAGKVNLKDSYAFIQNNEMYLEKAHISPYEKGNINNKDPMRTRKLLMHKRQITKLHAETTQNGLTLIPLSLYFKGSKVKVELALCQGKKNYDKRATIAERDIERKISRKIKEYR